MSTPDPLRPQGPARAGLRQWLREAFTGRPTPLLCMQVEVLARSLPGHLLPALPPKKIAGKSRLMSAETSPPSTAHAPVRPRPSAGLGRALPARHGFRQRGRGGRAVLVAHITCGQHMDESLAAAIVDSGMDVVAFSLAEIDEASNASRQGIPFSWSRPSAACRRCAAKQGVHLEVSVYLVLLRSWKP